MKQREHFRYPTSWAKILDQLSSDEYKIVWDAILDYMFHDKDTTLQGTAGDAWNKIKQTKEFRRYKAHGYN